MKIYWLYRMKYSQLQDRQSPSFYFNKELEDYITAGIFSLKDMEISDAQYTRELAPWLKSQTRFFRCEYNENLVSQGYVDMLRNKLKVEYYGEFFDEINPDDPVETARQRLRDNTNLTETETGTFQTVVWYTDETGTVEDQFITID